jgi:hypothetical protein
MHFWTIMLIVYGPGPLEGNVSKLPFPSEESCGAHLIPMIDMLGSQANISFAQCVRSDLISDPASAPSHSPMPKGRPNA